MTSLYLQAARELEKNPAQWQAYESDSNCVVLAGPGSGKTKVLTIKLARLLSEDVPPPRGIACLTYNTECVRELTKRLDKLGVGDSPRLSISTVHSFCFQHVLVPFARLAGESWSDTAAVASDEDRYRILADAMSALSMGGTPAGLMGPVSTLRRECLDRTVKEGWDPSDKLTKLAVRYEELLASEDLLDFQSMVTRALTLVQKHAWVRKALRARFPVIAVDEYQDLGRALDRLVHRLCFDAGVRLFAVGDPDQSIYGFNGAHPELLRKLAKRSDVTPVRLKLNYRSAKSIVAASEAALGETRDYSPTSDDEGVVDFHKCGGGLDGQVNRLVTQILPNLLQRFAAGNIVVLFRTQREGGIVEAALKDAGYEYVRLGSNSAYQRTPLTRIVEDMARWSAGGWKTGEPRLSRLLRRWTSLQGLLDNETLRRERLKLVRFLSNNRTTESARKWLRSLEESVLALDDCRSRLTRGGEIASLDELLLAVQPGHRLEGFTVLNLAGQAGSPNHLNLLTMHSSKGCEFDAVIIFGADEGSLPHYNSTEDEVAEARRVFYVGLSRARFEAHLLCSPPQGTDRYRQGPSRFVLDVRRRIVTGS